MSILCQFVIVYYNCRLDEIYFVSVNIFDDNFANSVLVSICRCRFVNVNLSMSIVDVELLMLICRCWFVNDDLLMSICWCRFVALDLLMSMSICWCWYRFCRCQFDQYGSSRCRFCQCQLCRCWFSYLASKSWFTSVNVDFLVPIFVVNFSMFIISRFVKLPLSILMSNVYFVNARFQNWVL